MEDNCFVATETSLTNDFNVERKTSELCPNLSEQGNATVFCLESKGIMGHD